MNQLLLDLEPPPRPTFDNFVIGGNAEPVAAVRRLLDGMPAVDRDRFVYVWGDVGSGCTHLLQAAVDACDGRYVSAPDAATIRTVAATAPRLLAVDDVQALDATAQEALFHAINALRDEPSVALLIAGRVAPRDLPLEAARDDLRSRLGWGLVYRLQRLDDDAKHAALARHAEERGFRLSDEVRSYLLTHCARDLGSLMQWVDALDRHAREQQRVVTVPLLRGLLQRESASSKAA